MDREEALTILSAKLDDYRNLSYGEATARIGDEEVLEVTGSSGTVYQIEIHFIWDKKPNEVVRVMGTIDNGTFRGAFRPVCSDLLVAPDDLLPRG
ncbi:MAG: hypothetical protein ACYC6N_01465 [Pirellulaceae bacterium]